VQEWEEERRREEMGLDGREAKGCPQERRSAEGQETAMISSGLLMRRRQHAGGIVGR